MSKSIKHTKSPSRLPKANILDNKGKFAHNVTMLKKYREQLKLSQAELAEEIGVSTRTIKYIESGQYGKSKLVKEAIEEWVKRIERLEKESIQASRRA